MYYKSDWHEVKERLLAWWNHAVLDRCCIAVHAPRGDSKLPAFPDLQHGPWLGGLDQISPENAEAVQDWWQDPELNYQRAITWFENNYFGGEALPITYINWGAMALAGMLGSPPEFTSTSVWYPAVIDDWESWEWNFNAQVNPIWQSILSILERFLEDAQGKYFVGSPELGNGADVLSLMRGMDRLALDLIEKPEAVKRGVDFISDVWVELMEQVHYLTEDVNQGGVLAWMGLWAPGRTDQIACDFSSLISPAMFQEFFVPEIVKMGKWCEYGVYHLDGPAAMKHTLDILLEIDEIKTIQFTPGIGSPSTSAEAYIPRYRKILNSGRNLYLLVEPHEVEKLLTELPPEGLYMRTYLETQDQAEAMIRRVGTWTARKNQFGYPIRSSDILSTPTAGARWDAERARDWYADKGWLVGCNYIPSTAVNQLGMWQADTFDPDRISVELEWAADLGTNSVRVFLHNLAWETDPDGFLQRIARFLTIADGLSFSTVLVLLDDCWNPPGRPGRQSPPVPGVHNSRWLQCPGVSQVTDTTAWPRLKQYVQAVVEAFAKDKRVLLWDIYNEPGNLVD